MAKRERDPAREQFWRDGTTQLRADDTWTDRNKLDSNIPAT